ncbi:MAG: inorganic phosphate transporter [Bianqueaceae bacterium]
MILCSLVMGLGTSIGGYRIIKTVGMDMVKLERYQGFSADGPLPAAFSYVPSRAFR